MSAISEKYNFCCLMDKNSHLIYLIQDKNRANELGDKEKINRKQFEKKN